MKNNINIVSKTLILCAHDNLPCALELRTEIDKNWQKNWQYTKKNTEKKHLIYQKQKENGKYIYIYIFFKEIRNIVSETLILGAHEAIPCAPE